MLAAIGNHLWQSTVFAGVMALFALPLRRNRAALRYRLWLAASVKFLVPFSLLVTLGSQFEWRKPPVDPTPSFTDPSRSVDFCRGSGATAIPVVF